MEIIKPGKNIPFTSYRRTALILSTVVNLVILAFLFVRGPQLGVDFAGGTLVHLKFQRPVTIPDIRQALSQVGLESGEIQDFGEEGSNEFLIRLEVTSGELGALGEKVRQGLSAAFGSDQFEIRRVESVGPKVGAELRRKGTWAVIAATIMMGIYLALRFELRFGAGAVIALIHDVLVTVGALMLAGYEFDLTVIAALLTIVGFSVNDTVVICDRIGRTCARTREKSWSR
jgi:preprotein translocase subunit SecF